MLLLLFSSVALRVALAPFGVGLYAKHRFVLLNLLSIAQTLTRLALLFLLLFGQGPRVLWVVIATVAADVAILLVTTFLSRRVLPALKFTYREIRWELVGTLTTFGFWNMLGWLAYLIRKSSDVLILNRMATPQAVTIFHLASLPDNQIESTLQRAFSPVQPAMIEFHATGRRQVIQTLYVRGGRYSLWAALLVITPLIVFREEFWSLYLGSAYGLYADTTIVMALLLARYWITCPNDMINGVAHATNQLRPLCIRYILAALCNVALTLYLVGVLKMGAVGSALATFLIAVFWEPIIMWKFSLGLAGVDFARWFKEAIWEGVLPSLVAAAFALPLRAVTRIDGWFDLAAVIACVCAVYLLTLLVFCLKPDERTDLAQFFSTLRSQIVPMAQEARAK